MGNKLQLTSTVSDHKEPPHREPPYKEQPQTFQYVTSDKKYKITKDGDEILLSSFDPETGDSVLKDKIWYPGTIEKLEELGPVKYRTLYLKQTPEEYYRLDLAKEQIHKLNNAEQFKKTELGHWITWLEKGPQGTVGFPPWHLIVVDIDEDKVIWEIDVGGESIADFIKIDDHRLEIKAESYDFDRPWDTEPYTRCYIYDLKTCQRSEKET